MISLTQVIMAISFYRNKHVLIFGFCKWQAANDKQSLLTSLYFRWKSIPSVSVSFILVRSLSNVFFVWCMLSFFHSDSCQNTFCLVSNRFKVKKPYIFSKNTFYPRIPACICSCKIYMFTWEYLLHLCKRSEVIV